MWGHNRGESSVPLNYNALKQALIDKGKSKIGQIKNRSILFLYQRYVTAYFVGQHDDPTRRDIALKLHRTEIVHFHPNGDMTLNGGDWIESQQTRHWMLEATGHYVNSVQPNDWSPRQHVLCGTVFYTGMRIGARGTLLSTVQPLIKNVPNAEAKVLRKRLTKLAQVYRSFAMMHEGSQQVFERGRCSDADVRNAVDDDQHEFDLELYKWLVHTYSYKVPHPYKRVQNALSAFYKHEVARRNLFYNIEVQPKEYT